MCKSGALNTDPPPLLWSTLRYVFDNEVDQTGEETIQARRD